MAGFYIFVIGFILGVIGGVILGWYIFKKRKIDQIIYSREKEVKKYVVRNSVLDIDVDLVRVWIMDDLAELQSFGWQHTTFHSSGSFRMESVWSTNSQLVKIILRR